MDYHRGIDHDCHDVIYFGTRAIVDTLPSSLRRREVARPGHAGAYDEAIAWLEREPQHLAIESDGELVFLEVGNRVGGADVVATFELATGVHLPSQELRILLGEDVPAIEASPTSTSLWHGWFVVPGHHLGGAHGGVDGIEFFRRSAAVLRWNELETGAPLPGTITYQAHEVPLAGIIATASAEETHRWLASLFAAVSLRQLADPELHQAVR